MKSFKHYKKNIIKWERYKSRPYLELAKKTSSERGKAKKRKITQAEAMPTKKTKIIREVKDPAQQLLDFFVECPGLRKLIGGKISLYFNPNSADNFRPTVFPQVQESQNQQPLTTPNLNQQHPNTPT